MPFLRNLKGTKLNFSQANLSNLVSLAYLEAMGNNVVKFRSDIQKHCQRIWKNLEDEFGKEDNDEWPGSGIQKTIAEELNQYAPLAVYEIFLSLKINEFQEPKKKKPVLGERWNEFGPKPEKKLTTNNILKLTDEAEIDPLWAVLIPKEKSQELIENAISEQNELFSNLGVAAKIEQAKNIKNTESISLQTRRSQWISFFKQLSKNQSYWSNWEKIISEIPPDQKNKTLDEWWKWWQDKIDENLSKNPKIYYLRRPLLERKKRAEICSQSWVDGTELNSNKSFRLENSSTGNIWYVRLCIEHLKLIFNTNYPNIEWDWSAIQKAIQPSRDSLIDWKGWQHLDESGSLKRLHSKEWKHGEKSTEDATELPQWAWMRTAMAMAIYDPEVEKRTSNAIALYNQISLLNLIPSSAAVRESGKIKPRFFEDHVWEVPDHYKGIQDVLYSAAVDTTWTGTSASSWERVRSKNAPVRSGRRKSTGVNDFLRTIDSHLRAQGRTGTDRPVTSTLPVWHLDIEEYISLRHENGQRLQPVILVSDLFMQKVNENANWTLFDPNIYPEILLQNGYHLAEKKIQERKKEHPEAHKIVSAEKLWKKILTQIRLGSPFITFEDSDNAFSISSSIPVLHGLDGVGSFPMPQKINGVKTFVKGIPNKIEWPVMAININNMISEQGNSSVEKWKESILWAYWMAERMYDACEDSLSPQTLHVRPLCLGAVGFYEAIRKAMLGNAQDETTLSNWVYRVSETWSTLNTYVDQYFCKKNGPAPIWIDNLSDHNLRTFSPKEGFERLRVHRKGGIGIQPLNEEISDIFKKIKKHRFSVRNVWAPFRQAATWAGVSPGGFGTLFPIEWVLDETRKWRLSPTNYLLSEMNFNENINYSLIFEFPEQPNKWPNEIKQMSTPDMAEWKIRMKHASLVRPWIDQSVSLTLPAGIPINNLSLLLQQAWWMGISNIRFEDPFKKPDLGNDQLPIIDNL